MKPLPLLVSPAPPKNARPIRRTILVLAGPQGLELEARIDDRPHEALEDIQVGLIDEPVPVEVTLLPPGLGLPHVRLDNRLVGSGELAVEIGVAGGQDRAHGPIPLGGTGVRHRELHPPVSIVKAVEVDVGPHDLFPLGDQPLVDVIHAGIGLNMESIAAFDPLLLEPLPRFISDEMVTTIKVQ